MEYTPNGPSYASRKPRQASESTETEVEETEFPRHTGGGWYELSNGEKVQGEEAAIEAEAALD